MSEPLERPLWWLKVRNRYHTECFNSAFALIAATARHRHREVARELISEIALEIADVASFWRAIFADDAEYAEFPTISHAYDTHHTAVTLLECGTGFEYDGCIAIPRISDADLLPNAVEMRSIYARPNTLSACRLLLKKRIMFALRVTMPDRRDPATLLALGYDNRVGDA